jgi:hypothetical protein
MIYFNDFIAKNQGAIFQFFKELAVVDMNRSNLILVGYKCQQCR